MRVVHVALAGSIIGAAVLGAEAEQPPQLTIERINSKAFQAAVSVPEYAWLGDGTVLLLDRRVPAEERTLQRLDPRTMQRTPACDAAAALASLAVAMGKSGEDAPKTISWPDEIAPSGSKALYVFGGDLYLLDLKRSTFRRLTHTEGEEKEPRFSPDGSEIAFVRGNDLWVLDPASTKERRLTVDGSDAILNGTLSWVYWEEIFGRRDEGYWWSPDGSAIAFLHSDEAQVDVSSFPMWEPANPEVKRQRYPKAGSVNPAVRLGIFDLARGTTAWVDLGDPLPEYIVRVAWLRDGRRLAVQTLDRLQRTLELLFADRADGRTKTILTEHSDTSLGVHDDLRFIDGGRRFIWASERDGRNHLYLYDLNGTMVRKLTDGDIVVRASSGVASVQGGVVAIDGPRHLVYFTGSTEPPMAPTLFRVSWDGSPIERVAEERGTHRVGFDTSASMYLDRFADIATPPGLFLHRSDGTTLGVVSAPAEDFLAPLHLCTPELFTVPADDGFPLPARIMKPAGFDAGRKYPAIVYVYGGPAAPVVWNDWQRGIYFDNVLLENGFVCFAVDPRSATAESKTLTDTSYGRLLSSYEVPDISAAVRWLKNQPGIDPDRVGIWGWSGGGSTTLQMMTHTELFKAGIAVAAVSDFRYYDTVWTEHDLGLPEQNPKGYEDAAPANFARDLHGRLLLVHGTFDDNVHPQNTWRFAHELIQAGIRFDMMIYPGQKHGIRAPRDTVHVYETMLAFWRAHL
jgi:dipeptidyl-peptidase-4